MKIKFSHDYPKLWGQKEAILLYVRIIEKEAVLHKDLIEYDTKNCKGEYYKLPKTALLQLIFVGDKDIPFCTLRRFTRDKFIYYHGQIGERFEIEIKEK